MSANMMHAPAPAAYPSAANIASATPSNHLSSTFLPQCLIPSSNAAAIDIALALVMGDNINIDGEGSSTSSTIPSPSRCVAYPEHKDWVHSARRGAGRTCTLARSLRLLRAQERAATKRNEELLAFHQGQLYENGNERSLQKQAGYALNAARSVLETVIAEKKVAASIIDEAECHLQLAQSMNAVAEEKLSTAEEQLGTLLDAAYWLRFPPVGRSRSRPPSPHPSSMIPVNKTPEPVVPAEETPILIPGTQAQMLDTVVTRARM